MYLPFGNETSSVSKVPGGHSDVPTVFQLEWYTSRTPLPVSVTSSVTKNVVPISAVSFWSSNSSIVP